MKYFLQLKMDTVRSYSQFYLVITNFRKRVNMSRQYVSLYSDVSSCDPYGMNILVIVHT